MAPVNPQKKLGYPAWIAGTALFFYFAVHLWLASQGKEFWMDETDGLYKTLKESLWQLIVEGSPSGQGSRSPLAYIFDRAWLHAWNDRPLPYWDLRLFFRVLPVTYWSAVNVFLFTYLWRYFWLEKNIRYGPAALFAFTIAQFSYTNNFASYYAIESRSYSLWLSCSMLHFLGFWQILRAPEANCGWRLFFGASVGLVLTTYASLTQIFLSVGILLAEDFRRRGRLAWADRQKKSAIVLATSLVLGIYYYAKFEPMSYSSAPFHLYFTSVLEVILKAFHHHDYHPAFLSFPILFVFIPLYWFRRSTELFACCVYALAMLANTYLLYLASTRSGGIYASRYAIYLLPSLIFLYLLGVVTLVKLASRFAESRWHRNFFFPAVIVLALVDALGRPYSVLHGLPQDIQRFRERRGFARRDTPACAVKIPHHPWNVERVNNDCRGITGKLPEKFPVVGDPLNPEDGDIK